MDISSDYKDLFKILNKYKVRYLVVGAYAVIYYTEPRYTKDIDIWVKADSENARKVYAALKEFGAPLKGILQKDFTSEGLVYQIGVAPVRIDIIMGLPGVEFDSAWSKRIKTEYAGVSINVMGKQDLIESKKAAARPQDALDLKRLKK